MLQVIILLILLPSAVFAQCNSTPMTILDSNGSPAFLVKDNPAGTGGTYVGYWPGRASVYQNAEFYCASTNADCSISFRGKGNWFFAFHASAQAPASVTTTFDLVIPATPGQSGQKLCTQNGTTLTWCD